MTTLLCVPIVVHDISSALAKGARAAERGADLIEWRIDEFFTGDDPVETEGEAPATDEIHQILHLVAQSPVPCIITCRPTWEGGAYDGDEDARIALFERLGAAAPPHRPPRYIDVELATYTRSANLRMKVDLAVDHPNQHRDLATGLILSIHDFQGRPADLTRRLLALRDQPAARIHKIAFRCRTIRDNLELLDLLSPPHRDRPTIALGMGEAGLLSRVLAPKFGAFLTFAALNEQERTAPGQPTITELLETYRFRAIGAATRLYGIVGWPVSHSRSPQIHNAGFTAINHDGVYLPLPVAPGYESFKATILELMARPDLHLSGLSITLPHKENLARLAREQGWPADEPTGATGAANTLTIERDERGEMTTATPTVANTDAAALASILADQEALKDRRIAILGAGGVARAAAWAALKAGADITVFNRTLDRAETLAAELGKQMRLPPGRITCAPLDAATAPHDTPHDIPHDIYINATSLGMEGGPGPDQSPLDVAAVPRSGNQQPTAIETVYTPLQTPFLKNAAAAGWGVTDGAELFIRQGVAQFRSWTGQQPPEGLFERLVR